MKKQIELECLKDPFLWKPGDLQVNVKNNKKSTGFWMNINNIFEFLKIQSSKN